MTSRTAQLQPAEWHPQGCVWLAFPSHEELWEEHLAPAQSAFAQLVSALSEAGEQARVLVKDGQAKARAQEILPSGGVQLLELPYGDIWLRDTGPIFVHSADGDVIAQPFGFNGWGKKYLFEDDQGLAEKIGQRTSTCAPISDWVLEGGSVDSNGAGWLLTTEECLLNENRNPGLTREDVEERLLRDLGAQSVVWLGKGLQNDHTDGHVDNVARFVGKAHAVCMQTQRQDCNYAALAAIEARLRQSRFQDTSLEVTCLPAPRGVLSSAGELLPASYVNFLIANKLVVMPSFGLPSDEIAQAALQAIFPQRTVIAIGARDLLEGGGAFHCISQHQPSPRSPK